MKKAGTESKKALPQKAEKKVRNESKASASLPATSLGNHSGKKSISIDATKGANIIGNFSISKAGLQFTPPHGKQGTRKSWTTVAKLFEK